MTTVVCASSGDARTHCTANTSAGVALVRSVGDRACLLGQSSGYDATGIWLSDRCGGEFAVSDVQRPPPDPPVSSSFGYYVGGQEGGTLSVGLSVFF